VFVNNIFDKRYYDAFYQSASPFVFIAPGRSASLVLQSKF
jgi:catecholate siderophore receptor